MRPVQTRFREYTRSGLNPPERAVALCVDEKSQVQALDRTAPILPIMRGVPEHQTHNYVRNGTTTLFAALEVATGRVEQTCLPRHRHQEFLRFLKQVAKAYPRVKLHIVCDNYATHKHPAVKAWLVRNPRITLHFTPTSGSWLNLVEIFFGIITRQAIRRGTFGSVRELTEAITTFIDGWNERCEPFVWTKDADTIITKAHRKVLLPARGDTSCVGRGRSASDQNPALLAVTSGFVVIFALFFRHDAVCCAHRVQKDGELDYCGNNGRGLLGACHLKRHKWENLRALAGRQRSVQAFWHLVSKFSGQTAAFSALAALGSFAVAVFTLLFVTMGAAASTVMAAG